MLNGALNGTLQGLVKGAVAPAPCGMPPGERIIRQKVRKYSAQEWKAGVQVAVLLAADACLQQDSIEQIQVCPLPAWAKCCSAICTPNPAKLLAV